jgi:phage protein D
LFDPGQPVELEMGYLGAQGGGLRMMIRGEITDLRAAFPAGGQPTLVVAGQNILHRFRSEQRSETYTKASYSEIAARVCKRISVPFVPVKSLLPEPRPDSITQTNEYDLVFLMRLARQAGYELVVSEARGQAAIAFGPPSPTVRPTYELKYGRSLIEFQPTISFANQVSEVVVRGWDPVKGEEIEVTIGGGNLKDKIAPGAQNPAKGRKEVIANQPVRDEKAARELAQGTLSRIHNDAVTATGSVVGLPDLRAGCQVHISGVGARFNGRYLVTGTTHAIGTSGYTTQFECRLEALSTEPADESLKD